MNKLIPSFLACCLLLVAGCATAQPAPQPVVPPVAPPIDTAIHWAGGATNVFLLQEPSNQYRLFVTGGGDLKVFYRTMVNSSTGVRKELLPKEPIQGGLREYEFTHKFSRMTIWMALEFMKGGARDVELTRVFSNGIGNVVSGEEYLKDKAEK